jgi:hypothetical protein
MAKLQNRFNDEVGGTNSNHCDFSDKGSLLLRISVVLEHGSVSLLRRRKICLQESPRISIFCLIVTNCDVD